MPKPRFSKKPKVLSASCSSAPALNELQFALALAPEMRGVQDAGWNTAHEAMVALDDFANFFKSGTPSRVGVRIGLGLYSHLAEASGFYEVPKKMLRISQGDHFMFQPFRYVVKEHADTGKRIAPNANKVMKDLVGHASLAGFSDLSDVFRDAFDSDVRSGYAHADYVIWKDQIRFPNRNGGFPRSITLNEFERLLNRAVNFFLRLFAVLDENIRSFDCARLPRAAERRRADWDLDDQVRSRARYAEDLRRSAVSVGTKWSPEVARMGSFSSARGGGAGRLSTRSNRGISR
jgi:hypothetical protein